MRIRRSNWSDIDHAGRVSPTGEIVVVHGIDAAVNSLMVILKTTRGERLMLPDFGMPAGIMLFDNMRQDDWGDIEQRMRDEIRRWDPRLELVSATARIGHGEHKLFIDIRFRVAGSGEEETREVAI